MVAVLDQGEDDIPGLDRLGELQGVKPGHVRVLAALEDGARWSILPGPVPIEPPVRILQGGDDPDVPWRHALELAQALNSSDVVFTLIKDGDHRLSRPQDIARLIAAVAEICG